MPHPDDSLLRLKNDLAPSEDQRVRILQRVREKTRTAHDLHSVQGALSPDAGAQVRIWNRIRDRISVRHARGILDHVRTFLTPDTTSAIRLNAGFLPRLQPVFVPVRPLKWAAAFALVLVGLRVSPLLFLAPQTIAQSSVLLRPTLGTVSLSLDGLSLPVDHEIELLEPVALRTDEGEATIILHDDGTIRLAPHASATLLDLADQPAAASAEATLLLRDGTVWVQGLLPDHLRGVSVSTFLGTVIVHGGSVSIASHDDGITIEVWDRHATFVQAGQSDVIVIAGERLDVPLTGPLAVTEMSDRAFNAPWTVQNLQRDAVHQRAIAQEQRERIAARAGILPTSNLYSVKRLAEQVDVLLTFNSEDALKKRIAQATTRFTEAATLLAEGQSGAVALAEYRTIVLDLASGSGDTATQDLIEQEVTSNVAQLGAQLPDDDVYAAKQAALAASTELPSPPLDASDVEASVIGDAVDALQMASIEGSGATFSQRLEDLAPYIEDLPEDGTLDPTVQKEVLSQLTRVADRMRGDTSVTDGSGALALDTVSRVVRVHTPPEAPVVPLTQEQIDEMVSQMLYRVFTYNQHRSMTNQLRQETKTIEGHPDQGTILRVLYARLQDMEANGIYPPEFALSKVVRTAIQDLRERQLEQVD